MKRLVLIALVLTLKGFSAETTPATTAKVATPGKILAGAELRPTTTFNGDNVASSYLTENNVLAGYQFTPDTWMYYRQDFATNLSNSAVSGVQALDGSLRGGVKNVFKSGNWTLNYEGRAYMPTSSFSSDSGLISQVRNYGIMNYAMNDQLTVYVQEGPTLDFYSQDRNVLGRVNPNFENRTYVGANWKITNDMTLYFPLKMRNNHLRTNNAAGSRWESALYVNPELFYTFNKNFYMGAGIETASFVGPSFGDFSIGRGFEFSKAYAVLGASL